MPGAGVFFIDAEGRALLQRRRDNGLWAGTGGALKMGETFEEAAKREAQEEMGLLPLHMAVLNVYSGQEQHYIYPNKDEVYVVSEYLKRYFIGGSGHYNPLGNHFFAFAMKNQLVHWLDPKPATYLDGGIASAGMANLLA